MKREIKFRAYSSHNHKMYPVSDIEWDIDGRIWVTADDGKNGIELIDEEAHLMQYTGLHDMNGREIYEGDIVKFFGANKKIKVKNEFGIIVYKADRYGAGFNSIIQNKEHGYGGINIAQDIVFGNVHENPELLEGKR